LLVGHALTGVFCRFFATWFQSGLGNYRIEYRYVRCMRQLVYWLRARKPSCRWQTRATRKHAQNCSNSTCLQRCRWQYWSIFIHLAIVASEICEIPRNSLKNQT